MGYFLWWSLGEQSGMQPHFYLGSWKSLGVLLINFVETQRKWTWWCVANLKPSVIRSVCMRVYDRLWCRPHFSQSIHILLYNEISGNCNVVVEKVDMMRLFSQEGAGSCSWASSWSRTAHFTAQAVLVTFRSCIPSRTRTEDIFMAWKIFKRRGHGLSWNRRAEKEPPFYWQFQRTEG